MSRSRWRFARLALAGVFWLVQLWWLGTLVEAWRAGPGATFRAMSVRVDDVRYDGWGLTFAGESGQALVVAYAALVTLASVTFVAGRGLPWLTATVVLLAWAGLFAANSLYLMWHSGSNWWYWVNILGFVAVVLQGAATASRRRGRGSPRDRSRSARQHGISC